MDIGELIHNALALAALLVSLAAFFFARRDRSAEAQKAAMGELRMQLTEQIRVDRETNDRRHNANVGSLGKIEQRLAAGDEVMKLLPNYRDLERLSNVIGQIAESVANQRGALESNTRMVERMNQFLMEKGT